jgi:hypothetical protein
MSERVKLEESIAELQDSIDDGMSFRAGPHTRRVVDAARKHLETLPKTRTEWRVSYSEGGETRTWRTKVTEQEAVESGAYALACGKSCVSINSYQVPA